MKKLILLCLLLSPVVLTYAQDIHYSQFYASPLTLNPALTGVNDCNYRVALSYRNQWASVTTPYTTPSISFDINNIANKLIKRGIGSAGLLILNDKAGDGQLSNLTIMGSAAYQRDLDAQKKMMGSVGVQFGYVQKRYDLSKLTFEEQWAGTDFNQSLFNGEQNLNNKLSYLNVNLGGLWAYKPTDKVNVFLGVAGFNLISPKETFYNDGKNKLSPRTVVHAGAKIGLNEKMNLLPMFLYMGQSKDVEVNFGTSLGYNLTASDAVIYLGGYYRMNDAVIVMLGGEYKKVRLGLSYDINTSSLKTASNGNGGFEISLSYIGCIGNLILDKPIQWCPRF